MASAPPKKANRCCSSSSPRRMCATQVAAPCRRARIPPALNERPMFLTKKHLDRRTFLRGMGATVALPLLDAMIPARALLAFTAARAVPRLAFVYFPHGAIMDEWTSSTPSRQVRAMGTPALGRILQPLAPFRDRLTIAGGIENRHAYGPVHAITPGTWLSGISAREGGMTADQIAADHIGQHTPIPSIAVATEEATKICAGIWEG